MTGTDSTGELESASSRFSHGFPGLTCPCLRFALTLDARWFVVPAALSFRKHAILLNLTGKTLDGPFE